MKFLLIRNRENGKRFYCISRGVYYSPVSPENFRNSLVAYFKGKSSPSPCRYRSGVYDLIEFASGSPCEKNLPPLTN